MVGFNIFLTIVKIYSGKILKFKKKNGEPPQPPWSASPCSVLGHFLRLICKNPIQKNLEKFRKFEFRNGRRYLVGKPFFFGFKNLDFGIRREGGNFIDRCWISQNRRLIEFCFPQLFYKLQIEITQKSFEFRKNGGGGTGEGVHRKKKNGFFSIFSEFFVGIIVEKRD